MLDATTIIAANRGPFSEIPLDVRSDAILTKPSGGLVNSLLTAFSSHHTKWISPLPGLSNEVKSKTKSGIAVVGFPIAKQIYQAAYGDIANLTFWFLHHHMFDFSIEPIFDKSWWEAFDAFVEYSKIMAKSIETQIDDDQNVVLLQDYHTCLVPVYLRDLAKDIPIFYFSHIPHANKSFYDVLPAKVKGLLKTAVLSLSGGIGFHSHMWKTEFLSVFGAYLPEASILVSPLPLDVSELLEISGSIEFENERETLLEQANGRQIIVSVDRMEPSKNVIRHLLSYEQLLLDDQNAKTQYCFFAFANPSRSDLKKYEVYSSKVSDLEQQINEKYSSAMAPVLSIYREDNRLRSLAALSIADVILIDPVRDGLNLVAKESLYLNPSAKIILSKYAGAYAELSKFVIGNDPFDLYGTATNLKIALEMEKPSPDKIREITEILEKENLEKWSDTLIGFAVDHFNKKRR